MAILNQNFDVAQALLDNGANVNASYPLQLSSVNGPETKAVSVLVEVLSQHTTRTLESLKYLFGKREGGPDQRPAFHINKFSILHFLSGSPHFTQIAQIMPKILNLCLDTYAESELINYKHPLLGTALYYAATSGHKTMVERLLQHGADETYNAGPDIDWSVQILLRPRESWTPLWAAILRFDDELKKRTLFPPEGPPGAWLNSNFILNSEKTIGLLSERTDDALAEQAIDQL
jgi:ankyrin repeat protein